ncbi:MAG TPA: hypothetical protein VF064_03350 [Pyrinomonadaceae bacterium]
MDNGAFVDALNRNAGGALSQAERDELVELLNHGNVSLAEAVWFVCEDGDFAAAEKNRAFVLAQYFGYLRRDPDAVGFDGRPDPTFEGYHFWLDKLDQFGGDFVRAESARTDSPVSLPLTAVYISYASF